MRRLFAVIAAGITSAALGQVPSVVGYQGRLLKTDGSPEAGVVAMTFALFDAASGGTAVGCDAQQVALTDGNYSVLLGGIGGCTFGPPAIAPSLFDGRNLYLELGVGGTTLTPRQRVASVPYAIRSGTAVNVRGGTVEATQVQVGGASGIWVTSTGIQLGTTTVVDASGKATVATGNGLTGDGTSAAPLAIAPDGVTAALLASDASSIGKATGGAMTVSGGNTVTFTGPVKLAADPTDPLGAVTRRYVDASAGSALLLSAEFDEPSGSVFADGTGRGNNLTAVAGGISAGSIGHTGKSIAFTGGVIRAPPGNTIANSLSVSVEAWIRPSVSLVGEQVILNKTGAYRLAQRDGAVEITVTAAGGACTVQHVGKTVIGTWHHVNGFYNGREVGVLLDGAIVGLTCAKGPLAATVGNPFYVGADDAAGSLPFTGFVDELRIWSIAPLPASGSKPSVATPDNVSCKTLLDAGKSTGNTTYQINPDGPGGLAPFNVFCDMTGGGWTWKASGVKFRLDYTGHVQTVQTPIAAAEYDFTLFGASSGVRYTGNETPPVYDGVAPGGRASGRKTFDPSTTLYVNVGGQGSGAGPPDADACQGRWGGWNGGGRGSRCGAGGGGGTDIRLQLGNLESRFIVAGGGGGCGYGGIACDFLGGPGGGLTGGNGQDPPGRIGGRGGTQTAGGQSSTGATGAGRFGSGGDSAQCNDEGGGGGGWYGGGAGGGENRPGGGGSSYVDGVVGSTTAAGVNNGHGYVEYIFK